MTLHELCDKYCFHDSSFVSLKYTRNTASLSLKLNFCCNIDDDCSDNDTQSQELTLLFNGVTDYFICEYGDDGNIIRKSSPNLIGSDKYFGDILSCKIIDGMLSMLCVDTVRSGDNSVTVERRINITSNNVECSFHTA